MAEPADMTFREYQEQTVETARYLETVTPHLKEHTFLYAVLGLTAEAGEVADKVKKMYRDGHGVLDAQKRQELAKELGDVLWYVARLSADWGISLEDVATLNIEKLQSRKRRKALQGSGDNR